MVLYGLLKEIHHVGQFQNRWCVMTKAYLVDVLSWQTGGKWENNEKAGVCGRSCASGS